MDRIAPTEVAKIVRQELKTAFPSVKFSVTTSHYSIRVRWIDGPANKEVEAVAGRFHGANFDGMQDLKEYNDLPYANDYIFFERDYSDAAMISAMKWYQGHYANPSPVEFRPARDCGRFTIGAEIVTSDYRAQDEIYRHMREISY